MNAHTLKVLEFGEIKEILASKALSAKARELVSSLRPYTSLSLIEKRLKETTEAKNLLVAYERTPIYKTADIRLHIKRAAMGGILQPAELLDVTETLRLTRTIKRFLIQREGEAPLLNEIASKIEILKEIEEEIGECINEKAEVVDWASKELLQIRDKIKKSRDKILKALNKMLVSPTYQPILQDQTIVIRNDRYCLPVKADFRGQFEGFVQDQSSSGVTLFMEPVLTAQLSNELKQLRLSETEEVRRILVGLSLGISRKSKEIRQNITSIGLLDFAFAKASLSIVLSGNEPKLNKDGFLNLIEARHPLLKGEVIPVSLRLGKDFTTLVITGPNTGGKTVCLKTIGLLTLMAQAGLHIPASPDSRVAVFDHIFADIGDEQSIQQSLSTFASHMKQIVGILRALRPNTLVLIDEIGTGTDPAEGSSLACAILEHLHFQGARTAVTTHSNELKTYAYFKDGVENAACEFDPVTLKPTFSLNIGYSGSSNALIIAERLGLSGKIIGQARGMISPHKRETRAIILKLEKMKAEEEARLKRAEEKEREAALTKERIEEELDSLKLKKRKVMDEASFKARRLIDQTKKRMNQILDEISRQPTRETEEAVRKELGKLEEEIEELSPPVEYLAEGEIEPGSPVLIKKLNLKGRVVAISSNEVEVCAGKMKIKTHLSDLMRIREEGLEKALEEEQPLLKSCEEELFLVGLSTEEALSKVEKYLGQAFSAGLDEVRLIHGKGAGILRKNIALFLKKIPIVASFCSAQETKGGDGVTLVRLKG